MDYFAITTIFLSFIGMYLHLSGQVRNDVTNRMGFEGDSKFILFLNVFVAIFWIIVGLITIVMIIVVLFFFLASIFYTLKHIFNLLFHI